ncbi:MAG TPA: prepilin-type N-terminal cleavage/methylation domain-containing protein [Phycisphaerales bacterium]|nr:prepilin-type N-terminal cleavage/methylation domain-containing protein [Phycisphaerales bacterium]
MNQAVAGLLAFEKSFMTCPRRQHSAFTLVELLVTIAIIAILIGLMVPLLGKVSMQRGRAATLARLRDSAAMIGIYAQDFKGSFPLPLEPGKGPWTITLASGWKTTTDTYFESIWLWHLAMTDRYFDGSPAPLSVFPAPRGGKGRLWGAFKMPCTLYAHAEFWNQSTRIGPVQYGATRIDQVLYPSLKTQLVSIGHTVDAPAFPPANDPMPGTVPAVMVDGNASIFEPARFIPGVPTGEGSFPHSVHRIEFYHGLHTVDGVRGRDIQ